MALKTVLVLVFLLLPGVVADGVWGASKNAA